MFKLEWNGEENSTLKFQRENFDLQDHDGSSYEKKLPMLSKSFEDKSNVVKANDFNPRRSGLLFDFD